MIVYFLMVIISLCFIILAEKVEKKKFKVLLYVLAVLPFFLVSAFRFDLGTDYTRRYVKDYNKLVNGIDVKNLEIGFKSLDKLCIKITHNPTIIFFITSGMILVLTMIPIFKKSKKIILSILIFFFAGVFFNSLNLVRQYISISLIFFGYMFIAKEKTTIKDYVIYIIFNIVAVLFHSTSIVAFILIFLNKKEITNWKWVISICLAILLFNKVCMNGIALIIKNTRFHVYLSGKMSGPDLSGLQLLVNAVIYIFMSYIYIKIKNNNNVNKEISFYINVQALSLIMVVLGCVHIQFNRISLYFTIFQLVSIPYFIYNMPIKETISDLEKLLKNKFKFEKLIPKFELIVTTICVISFVLLFGYTNILHNDNEVVPYRTIINCEWKIK